MAEILEQLPQKSDKREKRRKQNKKHKGNNDDFDTDELGELLDSEKTSTQEGLLNAEKKSLNSKRLTEIEKVLDDSSLDDNKKHELIKSIEAGYQKRLSELEKEEVDDVADLPEVEIGNDIEVEVIPDESKKSFNDEFANGLDEEFNDKYVFPRRAAEVTLARVASYEKINAENEKEGDDKFKEETKKLWEDLVVHGRVRKNENSGEVELINSADLDGKVALGLLKLAGINTDKVEYVAPGKFISGKINIDTGERDGLVVLEDGTVFIDHHGDFSKGDTSAAKHTLDVLVELGLLKEEEYLRNMVNFVSRVDNFDYPKSYFENYFKNSWKTLIGLSKMLSWDELEKFFKYKKSETDEVLLPEEPLSDGLLMKFGFVKKDKKDKKLEIGKSISHKERVLASEKELKLMEKEGLIIDSDRYGKICLNINGRVVCGIDAAKAFGCNTILSWNTENNNFFISNLDGKDLEDSFVDGKNIRGTMWLNPSDNDRRISLSEILNKMTDGKFEPSEAVGKILEKESAGDVLKDLSHEEISGKKEDKIETVDIKLEKISNSLIALNNKFKDFVLKNKGELFNKELLKRIHLLQDEVLVVQKIKGEGAGKRGLLDDLYSRINGLIIENWEESLIEFKKSQEQKEIEFNEKEELEIKDITEGFADFINNMEKDGQWEGYTEMERKNVITTIAKVEIRLTLKDSGIFDDEKIVLAENKIMEILNKK